MTCCQSLEVDSHPSVHVALMMITKTVQSRVTCLKSVWTWNKLELTRQQLIIFSSVWTKWSKLQAWMTPKGKVRNTCREIFILLIWWWLVGVLKCNLCKLFLNDIQIPFHFLTVIRKCKKKKKNESKCYVLMINTSQLKQHMWFIILY